MLDVGAQSRFGVAEFLPGVTVTLFNSRVICKLEQHVEEIALNESNADAYYGLGVILGPEETVTLKGGRMMSKRELFLEAIYHNPELVPAYNQLGLLLSAGDVITVAGSRVNRTRLFIVAIELDPKYAEAYVNLASTLDDAASVKLGDGPLLTKRDLYTIAIDLDASNARAYNALGLMLQNEETVALKGGRVLSKRDLFLLAIRHNSEFAWAHSKPGLMANSGGSQVNAAEKSEYQATAGNSSTLTVEEPLPIVPKADDNTSKASHESNPISSDAATFNAHFKTVSQSTDKMVCNPAAKPAITLPAQFVALQGDALVAELIAMVRRLPTFPRCSPLSSSPKGSRLTGGKGSPQKVRRLLHQTRRWLSPCTPTISAWRRTLQMDPTTFSTPATSHYGIVNQHDSRR
jgi:hypothetical protein